MRGGRSSVSVLPGVDTYILSFRRDAWEWAHGATPDRHRVAQAAVAWVTGTGLEEMAARWPFVRFSELQLAYERGDPLETQWRIVRRDASELYREVVEPAARHPVVSRFFPGLGHNFLFMPHAFSSEVLASVIFETDGRFRLYAPGRQGPVHVGPAPRVVDVLAEHLDGLERRACHT
ncbi:hypothetical protein OG539_08650 [Actinacidiphila glaucinigra]|uniref:hypothetical protein n=1 Tax=Actinacidiphila glaucinigra TaxID=235986 RepID=UPI003255CA57